MKINYTLFIILFFITGCNKENDKINVTRDMLIGQWLHEKETYSISYLYSNQKDTTVFFNHDTLEFDTSWYCKMNNMKYKWSLSSDTISISSCPETMLCEYTFYHNYKIIEFDEKNKEMILKEEISIRSPENAKCITGTKTIFKYYRKIVNQI